MAEYPIFTKEMKKTHTILVPQMAPTHFALLSGVFAQSGYKMQVLQNHSANVAATGLKYVHNDTCYPALLVIGQMIDALDSGNYDVDKVALLITQTGGGCRASNYIFLLRKALAKAGYGQIPVLSLNFSGLEKEYSLKLSIPMLRKVVSALLYGDELMSLANQCRPYENRKGDADRLVKYWITILCGDFAKGCGVSKKDMADRFADIAQSFSVLHLTRTPKVKVGIVGEIYVKYSPLGNNQLEQFLAQEDCEVNMPGLLGFVLYCVVNTEETIRLYGGNPLVRFGAKQLLGWFARRERLLIDAVSRCPQLTPPAPFASTMKASEGMIGRGNKMGEGWLLTAEMMELCEHGVDNIICAQPFGCLPNHICGKGMMNKIRQVYPEANIVAIDYDPSATRVNQENRIKLMLSVAKENLSNRTECAPQPEQAGRPINATMAAC